jgi:excinuclease ABC subunit C
MAPVAATEKIRKLLRALPGTPVVYFMKDGKGRVLYIGKAKNLKSRVRSYFHESTGDPRIRAMVSQVEGIETLQAPSEVDALLMEARLIKDIQPRYNDCLKDDKSFSMLAITRFDDFPKVWVVRETDEVDAELYGPFTSAGELRDAVRILQKIFKFATCSIEMREEDEKRIRFRPCLLHAINRCTAPCADRVSKERYLANIDLLRKFLKGGRGDVVADLQARMKEASRLLEFEHAGELRDQIKALEGLTRRSGLDYIEGDITPMDPREGLEELARVLGLRDVPRMIEGVDIAHLQGSASVGSLVCFVDGIPFKNGYRKYRIKTVNGIDDTAMIREVVTRRFRRLKEEGKLFPDVLLIDGGVGQFNAARAALTGYPPLLLSLAKREETLIHEGRPLALTKASPALRLMMYVRDEAHRFAQHYHHLLCRKAFIK